MPPAVAAIALITASFVSAQTERSSPTVEALVAALPGTAFEVTQGREVVVVAPPSGAARWVARRVRARVEARIRAAGGSVAGSADRGDVDRATLSLAVDGDHAALTLGIVQPGQPPASVTVRAPLDAPTAAYLGFDTHRTPRAVSLRFGQGGAMGLGVFDVDGDGHTELIVPRWAHISAYRLSEHDGRVQLERAARVAWPALPPRFPRPRRAQALVYVEDGRLLVSRTDREGAIALRWDVDGAAWVSETVTSRCAEGRPYDDGCTSLVLGRDYFSPTVTPADGAEPSRADETRLPFYAREVFDVVAADGSVRRYEARATNVGRVRVWRDGESIGSIRGGAALAMADFDLAPSGGAELLVSGYGRPGDGDTLRLYRAGASGGLVRVWQGEALRGGVLFATVGDLLGTGRPVFAAFEADAGGASRLWLIR